MEEGKYIQLGFNAEDIANYMAREIENNLDESITDLMKLYGLFSLIPPINLSTQTIKYLILIYAVDTDQCWDHKWQLSALFPSMGLSRRYHHMYRENDIPYDTWSNIHFGVIGKYCEFSESVLLGGADKAQRWSNRGFSKIEKEEWLKGDTICDKVAIKLGCSIYDEYIKGILINAYNILSYVVNDNVFKYYFQKGKCPDE